MTRTAIAAHPTNTVERVAQYLPSNYTAQARARGGVVITGEDVAGWTLDGYVIPRLASGLIFAREVTDETGSNDA